MNIQQYFEEKEQKEQEKAETVNAEQKKAEQQPGQGSNPSEVQVIPVIHEHAVVHKEVVETGKVHIRKSVTTEDVRITLPIINESYDIEHVPVESRILDTPPPPVRYEGEVMIIPVLKEITVVQKKYEVVEELRITRRVTETPMVQEITLRKEHIHVERSANDAGE
jgi:uncharacterized protein (TIGR02271 family)